MQQQQQGQTAPIEEDQDAKSQSQPARSDNDDTWGLGSASALNSLRRQNFRGRRSPSSDDSPKPD